MNLSLSLSFDSPLPLTFESVSAGALSLPSQSDKPENSPLSLTSERIGAGAGEFNFSLQAQKPDLSGSAFKVYREDPSEEGDKMKPLSRHKELQELLVDRFVKKASKEMAEFAERTRDKFIDDFLENFYKEHNAQKRKAKTETEAQAKPEKEEGKREVEREPVTEPKRVMRKVTFVEKAKEGDKPKEDPKVRISCKRRVDLMRSAIGAGSQLEDASVKKAKEEGQKKGAGVPREEPFVPSAQHDKFEWLTPGAEAQAIEQMQKERAEQEIRDAFEQFTRLNIQSPRAMPKAVMSKKATSSYIA
jgi:hypothetical protein